MSLHCGSVGNGLYLVGPCFHGAAFFFGIAGELIDTAQAWGGCCSDIEDLVEKFGSDAEAGHADGGGAAQVLGAPVVDAG